MEIWIGKYILIQFLSIYWHQILLKVYFWSFQMVTKFYGILQVFILVRFSQNIWKKCCFLNNIFYKFEIVVCFTPLLHGVERNTILNFDSITEIVMEFCPGPVTDVSPGNRPTPVLQVQPHLSGPITWQVSEQEEKEVIKYEDILISLYTLVRKWNSWFSIVFSKSKQNIDLVKKCPTENL